MNNTKVLICGFNGLPLAIDTAGVLMFTDDNSISAAPIVSLDGFYDKVLLLGSDAIPILVNDNGEIIAND